MPFGKRLLNEMIMPADANQWDTAYTKASSAIQKTDFARAQGTAMTNGTGSAYTAIIEDYADLTDMSAVTLRLHADMLSGATLRINALPARPIYTVSGKPITAGAKAGSIITLIYNAAQGRFYAVGVSDPDPYSAWPIGSTRMTLEPNLSADWLYCNGDSVAAEDYPALTPLLSKQKFGVWDSFTDSSMSSADNPVFDGINTLYFRLGDRIRYYAGKPTAPAQESPYVWPSQFLPPRYLGKSWVALPRDSPANLRGHISYSLSATSPITQAQILPDSVIITDIAATNKYYILLAHSYASGNDNQNPANDVLYYAESLEGPYTAGPSFNRWVARWSGYFSGSLTAIDDQIFYRQAEQPTRVASDANISSWSSMIVRNSSGTTIMSGTEMTVRKVNGVYFLSESNGEVGISAYTNTIGATTTATLWSYPSSVSEYRNIPAYFSGVWYVAIGDKVHYSTAAHFDPASFTGVTQQLYPVGSMIPVKDCLISISSSSPLRLLINDPSRYSLPVIPSVLPTYIRGQ